MVHAEQVRLRPRLQTIARQVPQGARLADIGTDHAHLPIWLMQQGRIADAIASDIRQGPLSRAAENAAAYGMQERLQLRLGGGLDGIQADECDTIVIAGMGGETIAEILHKAPWTAAGRHLLILQPMTMQAELRQFLWENGYDIEKETICQEDHRYYVVITARGGSTPRKVRLSACCLSPALCRDPMAETYLRHLLRREARALAGLEQASAADDTRLTAQREVVACLRESLEEWQ